MICSKGFLFTEQCITSDLPVNFSVYFCRMKLFLYIMFEKIYINKHSYTMYIIVCHCISLYVICISLYVICISLYIICMSLYIIVYYTGLQLLQSLQ